jgi:hypothetical protein
MIHFCVVEIIVVARCHSGTLAAGTGTSHPVLGDLLARRQPGNTAFDCAGFAGTATGWS